MKPKTFPHLGTPAQVWGALQQGYAFAGSQGGLCWQVRLLGCSWFYPEGKTKPLAKE